MSGSAKVKVDFYESGIGDTIIVTFPDGGVGVVDAHPSPTASRPDILELVADRLIHFVCLTHPHADHGRDLVPLVEKHARISEFWHTNSQIQAFIYRLREIPSWPSEVREFAVRMSGGYANFLIDLYGAVVQRDLPIHDVKAGNEPRRYAGVEVHELSPEESISQGVLRYWLEKAGDPAAEPPDPNTLSAILALRYGDSVVLLGADALRVNWRNAVARYRKLQLPKAAVLKIPHHGALNALDLKSPSPEPNYLDVCRSGDAICHSVLFAGDTRHPNDRVYQRLRSRTAVHCLSNGRRGRGAATDLHIEIEGAEPVAEVRLCQPHLSFEVDDQGDVNVLVGHACDACPV